MVDPIKRSFGLVLSDIFIYGVLLIFTLMCFYPFYYIFIYSISDPNLAEQGLTVVPVGVTLSNYARVLKLPGIHCGIPIAPA